MKLHRLPPVDDADARACRIAILCCAAPIAVVAASLFVVAVVHAGDDANSPSHASVPALMPIDLLPTVPAAIDIVPSMPVEEPWSG